MPGSGGDYCAVFGDVVRSRQIADRADAQELIVSAAARINMEFADQVAVPFRVVAGDELRGLLRSRSRAYEVISHVCGAILPCKMRFAVGIGELATGIGEDIDSVDGLALQRAAEAMLILKNQKRAHGRLILFSSDDQQQDQLANALAFLISRIKEKWSAEDWDKVAAVEQGASIAAVAADLGVAQPALTRSLSRLNYWAVSDGERALSAILQGN